MPLSRRLGQQAAAISILLFTLSLILPTVGTCQIDGTVHENPIAGFMWLMTGWAGILVRRFAWFANPLLVACLFFLIQNKMPPRALSGITLALGISAFIQLPSMSFNYIDDGDDHLYLCGWNIGAFLWLGAVALPLIYRLMAMRLRNSGGTSEEEGGSVD